MQHEHNHDFTHKINKGKDNEIEIKVTVPYAEYAAVYEGVLSELGKDVKVAGFRPGKAPRDKIVEAAGSHAVSHTLEHLLPEIAENILTDENLTPITQLEYSVDDLSEEKGLQFTISFVEYPEVKLGNLEKLNVKEPSTEAEVSDEEILQVIKRLLERKEDEAFGWLDLSDEMVAELDIEGVKTIAELKEKISDRLKTGKQTEQQRKFEDDVLKEAIKSSKLPVPKKLLEGRVAAMIEEYKQRIQELGVDLAEFLKAQDLDEEKLKKQKEEEALQSLQQELLLNEIAKSHQLFPETAEIDAQISAITDPATRERLQSPAGRRFVFSTLLQQRAFTKLLGIVTKKQA